MSSPESPEKTILLDVVDGVATLTLNRPGSGNLFDAGMARELKDVGAEVQAREDVRVVVLRGAGKAFCKGGDLGAFAAADDASVLLDEMATNLHLGLLALASGDAPIVAVVQGAAFGAGLSLVAFADVVVASEAASFVAGYPSVGLSPDGGMTWTLPRKIGAARAASLLLTGTRLTAGDALAAGLVSEVLPADDLEDRATAVIATIAAGPTGAFGAIRRLLDEGGRSPLASHLDAEHDSLVAQAAGAEGREGIEAFGAGRRPRFAPAAAEVSS